MLHQGALPRRITFVHPPNLGNSDVRLVNDSEEILGEVVQQAVRRFSGFATVNVTGIVFDATTKADLLHHLQVVGGAHSNALGFEKLPLFFKPGHSFFQLVPDIDHGPPHRVG